MVQFDKFSKLELYKWSVRRNMQIYTSSTSHHVSNFDFCIYHLKRFCIQPFCCSLIILPFYQSIEIQCRCASVINFKVNHIVLKTNMVINEACYYANFRVCFVWLDAFWTTMMAINLHILQTIQLQ